MTPGKINNKGQARLFKNDFLEMLTKTHPLIIWGMYLPVICYFLYIAEINFHYSTAGFILLIFFSGILFWSFFEYIAHRFLFHWITELKWGKKFTYTLHGTTISSPGTNNGCLCHRPSLIFSSVIFGLMYLLLGTKSLMFFPGFILDT